MGYLGAHGVSVVVLGLCAVCVFLLVWAACHKVTILAVLTSLNQEDEEWHSCSRGSVVAA